MTLIQVAEDLLLQHGADDVDSGRLADLIDDLYGCIDRLEEITPEDARALIDAAR